MRRLLFVALAVTLAACGSDSVGPIGSISGTYELRTVNGSPLPYAFNANNVVTSDVVTLYNDGTYTDDLQLSTGQVLPEQGYFTENNGAITFSPDNGYSHQGSISGSVLTEIFSDGTVEVFQRQ